MILTCFRTTEYTEGSVVIYKKIFSCFLTFTPASESNTELHMNTKKRVLKSFICVYIYIYFIHVENIW